MKTSITTKLNAAVTEGEAACRLATEEQEAATAAVKAHQRIIEATEARLAELAALTEPTPKDIADEVATKRRLDKQKAQGRELAAAAASATQAQMIAERTLEAARLELTRAELAAESDKLLADLKEFEASFVGRHKEHFEKVRAIEFRTLCAGTYPGRPGVIAELLNRASLYAQRAVG